MADIQKVLVLDRAKYFETHLSLLNCILPERMTPKEIEVMAAFMSLEGDIADKHRFSSVGKKIVKDRVGLSDQSLSNHLKALREKKFLLPDAEGKDYIRPILEPDPIQQRYLIGIRLNK